jgi:NTP pyrophosphatase (non-canonical NTP hydrolase)
MAEDNLHPDQVARMEMLNKYGKQMIVTIENVHGVKESGWVEPTNSLLPLPNDDLSHFAQKIVQWHHDRNLIEGSTDKDQYLKLIQEAGELSDNICKGKDISDDIGDMIVVLLNIAERNGLTLRDCLAKAWDDIKDRKGKMVDGIFVKEGD